MLVELIEDEESLKKSDPAEVDNLVRGFSKFDPFSKNHHKFSDHCLCRKCKWDPNFRSKRILESEFVEIHAKLSESEEDLILSEIEICPEKYFEAKSNFDMKISNGEYSGFLDELVFYNLQDCEPKRMI